MAGYQTRAASSVASLDMNNFVIDIGAAETLAPVRSPEPAHRPRRRTNLPPKAQQVQPMRQRTPRAVEEALVPRAVQAPLTANVPIETIAASARPTPEPAASTVQTGDPYTDSVAILPRQYAQFRDAPAERYQNTIKPLTAPPLGPTPESAALQLNLVRATQRLYFLNLEALQRQDWYDFLFNEVIGLARRPESEFILVQRIPSATDELTLPGANPTSRYGRTTFQSQQTPSGGGIGGSAGGGHIPGAGGIAQGGGYAVPLPVSPGSPGSPGLASRSPVWLPSAPPAEDDVFGLINNAVLDDDPSLHSITTGSRFSRAQDRVDDLLAQQAAQDATLAKTPDQLAQLRRERRLATHNADVWLNDARQATGFVVLNPLYVAAKREALRLVHLYCTGTSLGNVPESEFVRRRHSGALPDGRPNTQWMTVRTMFGRLVAYVFLLSRMEAGGGVRYANDLGHMTAQINALLREFVYRVGYDDRQNYKTFYIVEPRNDERRQPVWERASELRFSPYESTLGPGVGGARAASSLVASNRNRITLSMLAQ
jgi:hypothetical protein